MSRGTFSTKGWGIEVMWKLSHIGTITQENSIEEGGGGGRATYWSRMKEGGGGIMKKKMMIKGSGGEGKVTKWKQKEGGSVEGECVRGGANTVSRVSVRIDTCHHLTFWWKMRYRYERKLISWWRRSGHHILNREKQKNKREWERRFEWSE